MDEFETRRRWLLDVIRTRFGDNKAAFATFCDIAPDYVSRMLSTGAHRKNVGEKLARKIEAALGVARGTMDGKRPGLRVAELGTLYGYAISREAAHLAAEWEKLKEPARSQILVMVESLVAKQILDKRAGRKPHAPKENHETHN